MSTQDFLHALYGNVDSGYVEIRIIGTDYRKQMYRALPLGEHLDFSRLHALNATHNVYFRVALSHTERSRKNDISALTALWCDIDSGDLTALNDVRPVPNILVKSGRGYHGYWLLDEPLAVTMQNIHTIEQTLHGMAIAVKGDEKCKDVTRILRVPGFVNRKPEYAEAPPMCEVLKLDDSPFMRCTFAELESAFAYLGKPDMPRVMRHVPPEAQDKSLPTFVKNYLTYGATNGERNATLFFCACRYHDAGYDEHSAFADLGARAANDGLSQQEIAMAIRSAYAQAVTPQLPRHMATVAALEDTYV